MNRIMFLGDSGIIEDSGNAFSVAFGEAGLSCADFVKELSHKKLQKLNGNRQLSISDSFKPQSLVYDLMPKIEAEIKIENYYFENSAISCEIPSQRCFLTASLSWIEIHDLSRDYTKFYLSQYESSLYSTEQLKSA